MRGRAASMRRQPCVCVFDCPAGAVLSWQAVTTLVPSPLRPFQPCTACVSHTRPCVYHVLDSVQCPRPSHPPTSPPPPPPPPPPPRSRAPARRPAGAAPLPSCRTGGRCVRSVPGSERGGGGRAALHAGAGRAGCVRQHAMLLPLLLLLCLLYLLRLLLPLLRLLYMLRLLRDACSASIAAVTVCTLPLPQRAVCCLPPASFLLLVYCRCWPNRATAQLPIPSALLACRCRTSGGP